MSRHAALALKFFALVLGSALTASALTYWTPIETSPAALGALMATIVITVNIVFMKAMYTFFEAGRAQH